MAASDAATAGLPDRDCEDRHKLRAADLPRLRGGRAELFVASLALNVLALALPVVILQIYDRIIPN